MSDYIALKHDPCPRCSAAVTHFSTEQDEIRSMFDDHSVSPPARITLLPCGHEVHSYVVDTIQGTVEWNTAVNP